MANLLSNTTIGGYQSIHTGNIGSYALTSLPSHNHDDRYYTETESDGRYLRTGTDSEQEVGLRYASWNDGVRRMNTDPRWNESGYDADLGCLHIWSWTAAGVAYGRAGIALFSGSAYQYLTTKSGQTGIFVNNQEIIHSGNIGSQSVSNSNYINSTRDTPGSALQYWQAPGLGIDEAPSGDWHNTIRMGHGSPLSYYSNTLAIRMTGSGVGDIYTQTIMNGNRQGWKKHWNDGNHGSGSGLDADLLDGQQGSYYQPASSAITTSNIGSQSVNFANSSTSAAYLNYTGVGGTQLNANTFSYGRASNYYSTAQILNSPENAYASLYNFGGDTPSALSLQLFASVNHNDTSSTRNLWFRVGNNLGFQNDWKQIIHSGSIGSQSVSYATTAGALSSMNISQFTNNSGYITGYTETDTLASVTGRGATTASQMSFTKTDDHAISVGTIRGRAVGVQSGEFIQLYERVNIGGPNGWGASNTSAPSYGLSVYGGATIGYGNSAGLAVTGRITVQNGNDSGTLYGPNATWGAYLYVGAAGNNVASTTAQVISTDGNLHLDSGSGSKQIYMNYYSGMVTGIYGGLNMQNTYITNASYLTTNTYVRAGTNVYTDQNYGYGLVGLYSAERYQGVFAMGDAYKLSADGTGTGNLYGLAWSHPNTGGQTKGGLEHQLLVMNYGVTQTAIGTGIWTAGLITTTSYGTSANWKSAYDWGNHASAGYQAASTAITTSNIGSQSVTNSAQLNGLSKIQLWNNSGQGHSTYQTFGAIPSFGVWFMQNSSAGDTPQSGSQYYVQTQGLGSEYGYGTAGGNYALMTAVARDHARKYTYYRTLENGGWGSWSKGAAGYADEAAVLSSMNISQFTNNSGYLTGITSGQVTSALGYTPYNASNPSSYITSGDTVAGLNTTYLGTATSNIGSSYTRVIRNENGAGGAPNYAPILHVAAGDTMWQIAGAHAGQTTLVWRSGYNGGWGTPWWTIYHSGNFTDNSSNWNTAYGWGNHASAGYLTSVSDVWVNTTGDTMTGQLNIYRGGVSGQSTTVGLRIGGLGNYESLELGIEDSYVGVIRSYGNDLRYYAGHWRSVGNVATEHHSHAWYTSKIGSADWSTAKMVLDHDGILNVPKGYVSNGNPWGTANSAYFPNGITTAGNDNWVYGHTYVGNAPGNGAGHEYWSDGSEFHKTTVGTASHGQSGKWLSLQSALGNFIPYSFESERGNHSWGTVARYRINNGESDRPSIQFSWGGSDTRWNVGYCYADDLFRITQNMGYRNDNSTSDGWGTERFRIDTSGNTYAAIGGTLYANGSAVITSANIGSQSVSYASTAGSAPANGGNSSTVGGYSVSVGASANTIPTRNANGYLIPESWIQLNGHYGLYSGTNNAHFYPSNGTYGPWRVAGGRGGWNGLEFDASNGQVVLMVNPSSNTTGFHNNSYGWQFFWESGILYVYKSTYGGGTQATVLDSSNYSSWAQPIASAINTGNIGSQSVSYATSAGSVAWTNVSSRPTALSQFTNDLGNYGGFLTSITAHSHAISDVSGLQTALDGKQASGSYLTTSGKAADSELIDGIDSSRIIYGDGSLGSTNYSDMNNTAQKSGFFFYNQPTGNPFGDWTHWINCMGNSWNPNYGFQLAHAFHSNNFAVRVVANGGFSSWRTIIDSGNIGSQSVSYASTAGSATNAGQLNTYGYLVGDNWDTYYTSGKLRVASAAGATGTGRPPSSVHNYGGLLSYGISGEDMFQMYFPDNAGNSIANSRKLHYRTGRGTWCDWRTVVDMVGDTLTIVEGATPKIVVRGSVSYGQPTSASIELVGDADGNQTQSYRWISTAPDWGGQEFRLERKVNNVFQLVGRVPKNTNNLEWQGTIVQGLSDSRVKTNVVSMTEGLDKIDRIRPVTFDWVPTENVSDREGADFGFIAQELEEVLPEVVHTRGDGYKTVMYEKVVPVLVQAMKEQQAMIEALRAEIDLLKTK